MNKKKIITAIAVAALVIMSLTACDGGGEDNSGANWLMIILVVLCWLKG